jgi:hypothetical protein
MLFRSVLGGDSDAPFTLKLARQMAGGGVLHQLI